MSLPNIIRYPKFILFGEVTVEFNPRKTFKQNARPSGTAFFYFVYDV